MGLGVGFGAVFKWAMGTGFPLGLLREIDSLCPFSSMTTVLFSTSNSITVKPASDLLFSFTQVLLPFRLSKIQKRHTLRSRIQPLNSRFFSIKGGGLGGGGGGLFSSSSFFWSCDLKLGGRKGESSARSRVCCEVRGTATSEKATLQIAAW